MNFIYICGKGDLDMAICMALMNEDTPYAPGKLFDRIKGETFDANSLKARLDMLDMADEVWVVGDDKLSITQTEIEHAKKNSIPIRYFLSKEQKLAKAIIEGGN